MDKLKGLDTPGTSGWTLNETTDLLLKKEFDYCREKQTPNRLFIDNDLSHLVPFNHPDMDDWRNSLNKGLMLLHKDTNIILSGGVDDIWQHKITKELIVFDYNHRQNLEE